MKWLVLIVMVCSGLFSDIIAVASSGNSLNSNISSKASRCNYYIFIDENGKTLEVLQNPHKAYRPVQCLGWWAGRFAACVVPGYFLFHLAQ